jgi:hypothetical protein
VQTEVLRQVQAGRGFGRATFEIGYSQHLKLVASPSTRLEVKGVSRPGSGEIFTKLVNLR